MLRFAVTKRAEYSTPLLIVIVRSYISSLASQREEKRGLRRKKVSLVSSLIAVRFSRASTSCWPFGVFLTKEYITRTLSVEELTDLTLALEKVRAVLAEDYAYRRQRQKE